jgi:5'-3' exonuclease
MGIPGYFAHIIKQYVKKQPSTILYEISQLPSCDYLFIDANSIIYDTYHTIKHVSYASEDLLIETTIEHLFQYIQSCSPTTLAYIAFDGIAPMAKMKQQKSRRLKSCLLSSSTNISASEWKWETANITPGTHFMTKLMMSLQICLTKNMVTKQTNSTTILLSSSEEPGEGEHKIFQYIRTHDLLEKHVWIYGLDADLIMLSIFQHHLVKSIHIIRERPCFLSCFPKETTSSNPSIFLDQWIGFNIKQFVHAIIACFQPLPSSTFGSGVLSSHIPLHESMYPYYEQEYACLCFFLGNDFLPHFPALNIRRHGIQSLIHTYKTYMKDHPLIQPNHTLNWKHIHMFISYLAKQEESWFISEHHIRDHIETMYWKHGKLPGENIHSLKKESMSNQPNKGYNETAKDNHVLHTQISLQEYIPQIYRGKERYICPYQKHWQSRYYHTLFPSLSKSQHVSGLCPSTSLLMKENTMITHICQNYMEGFLWVYTYYTNICPDWSWKYQYHYAPLLQSIQQSGIFCGKISSTNQGQDTHIPMRIDQQLSYVLPFPLQYLNPYHVSSIPSKISSEPYDQTQVSGNHPVTFEYAYCTYLWECYVIETSGDIFTR